MLVTMLTFVLQFNSDSLMEQNYSKASDNLNYTHCRFRIFFQKYEQQIKKKILQTDREFYEMCNLKVPTSC